MTVVFFSHALCAAAYVALAAYAARSRHVGRYRGYFIAACTATVVWAALAAVRELSFVGGWMPDWIGRSVAGLDALRMWTWVLLGGVLIASSGESEDPGEEHAVRRAVPWTVGAVGFLALTVAIQDFGRAAGVGSAFFEDGDEWGYLGKLALSLFGLLTVENLFRNAGADRFWSVKFLCFALGGLFAFDFYIYADAVLFGLIDFELIDARGVIALLVAPLVAVAMSRNQARRERLAVSRRFVFHTAALFGAGLYLVLMGAIGYYIRHFGGSAGPILQTGFLFFIALCLAVFLFSGSARAYARVFVTKTFFALKYDYRDEWLRFIDTISRDDGESSLRQRVLRAVGNLVDSPGAALFEWDDASQTYALVAEWNYSGIAGSEPADGAFAAFLRNKGWVVDLAEIDRRRDLYGDLAVPQWLASLGNAWLVVPLMHASRLYGFVVLHRPRGPREVNWEDFDLLRTVGRQAASYLSEQEAARGLADVRQIEIFNRRFAFVIHDIKTTISQLSLMLTNADRHGANPEFQRDLLLTVRGSVEGMQRILAQINAERRREADATGGVDLAAAVRRAVEGRRGGELAIALSAPDEPLPVRADEARISSVVNHLLQNAVEAAGAAGRVSVRVRRQDRSAIVEVEDDGPGMDAEFVRDKLFRPFGSTKQAGYGIGGYQCRELIRELGGQLAVSSVPGRGTTMRVSLPTIDERVPRIPSRLAAS